jgi:GNAT superfamily N-acetyltransferase
MQIHEVSTEELDYVTAVCLDPSIPPKWREAMKTSMGCRIQWLKTMMHRGLQISVVLDKPEVVIDSLGPKNAKFKEMAVRGNFPEGLIEYVPIEYAPEPVKGEKSLFIDCIWVPPPFWHTGVAKVLLEKVIEKARHYGGVSVVAYEGDKWFGFFPYMPASFFKRFGFKEVCRDRSRVLLHLSSGAYEPPSLIHPKTRDIEKGDKMIIDVYFNSQCPWSGWMVDKTRLGMKKCNVIINAINTDNRKVIEKYGISRGISLNGKPIIKRMASWKEIEPIIKQSMLNQTLL